METRTPVSRLSLVLLVASLPFAALAGCASERTAIGPADTAPLAGALGSVSSDEALQKLVEGNARFVGNKDNDTPRDVSRRSDLAKGQHPFAGILTCSDSRVPPELVFDQELGDLFVVRVAGNTADDVGMGSLEYAVEHLGVQLVVVMGHEKCGAVAAAVTTAKEGGELPGHLPAVVADILPVVKQGIADGGDAVHNCVWHNAANVAAKLRSQSPILSEAMEKGRLRICAAVYDLDTGMVRFLPQPPQSEKAGPAAPHGDIAHGESEHEAANDDHGHQHH
ncbi:MAG: carbonic anhydrase [Phycisphaerae bacterium]|nr:carbonic anhydrase [Phycisphaerae bacterium]